jgi:hypothetical protein
MMITYDLERVEGGDIHGELKFPIPANVQKQYSQELRIKKSNQSVQFLWCENNLYILSMMSMEQ